MLYYETYGSGPPVIFLHGFASDSLAFRNQIDAFSKNYQVILIDLAGHGRSPMPEGGLSTEVFAQGVKEVIDHKFGFCHLQFDHAHYLPRAKPRGLDFGFTLVGWSMGGRVALKLYELYKELMGSLVLVATTPHYLKTPDYPYGIPRKFFTDLKERIKADPQKGLNYFRNLVFAKEKNPKELKDVFIEKQAADIAQLFAVLDSLEFEDLRPILPTITAPTLLVHGELDQVCYLGNSEYMAGQIKGSRLEIIKGAAHAPFLTKPEVFNRIVLEFLDGNR